MATTVMDRPVTSHHSRASVMCTCLRWIRVLAGIVLAIAWLRSSAAHLSNPYYFLSTIYQYELVGPTTGAIVAAVVPSLQLVLAVCLLFRLFMNGAFLLSAVLLCVFAGVQGWAISQELNISCGCFGAAIGSNIGQESLALVGVLLLAAVAGYASTLLEKRLAP